ncbi:MAG: RluA family pseudouridine synthase [Deltaproteobacteria bacterium]|nr:RluA family pseudouridine synthase [Deltaproteobacteria bacterium]
MARAGPATEPPFRVAYRDRWLLVVDKPTGLATQPTRSGEANLYDHVQGEEDYVALHHRLDRPASGLILLAVHRDANVALARAFREHQVEREYRAVLYGETVGGQWCRPLEGKPAHTEVVWMGQGSGMTAVQVRLRTGRHHQIRQHAAMEGTPVVGDRRYAGEAGRAWPRLALHAWRLSLVHPVTGAPIQVESSLPTDLEPLWVLAGG